MVQYNVQGEGHPEFQRVGHLIIVAHSRRREPHSRVFRRVVDHTPFGRCFVACSVSRERRSGIPRIFRLTTSSPSTRMQRFIQRPRTYSISSQYVSSKLKQWTVLISFDNLSWNLGHNLRVKVPTGGQFYRNTRRHSPASKRFCRVYTVPAVSLQRVEPAFHLSFPSHRAGRPWREATRVRLLRVDNRTQR